MLDWLPLATAITLAGSLVGAGIWIGSVNTKQKDFKETIQEIKNDIREINKNILKIFSRLGPKVTGIQSPLQLTDFGKDISERLDAVNWANRLASVIQMQVEDKEAYDIQEFSFEYVQDDENYSDEERSLIRKVAYEKGIPEKMVRRVLGVELRDKLLDLTQV